MKALRIIKCSDTMMWYRGLVGEIVPLRKVFEDCYMSKEPDGYLNIVKLTDAEIIEVEDESDKAHRRNY